MIINPFSRIATAQDCQKQIPKIHGVTAVTSVGNIRGRGDANASVPGVSASAMLGSLACVFALLLLLSTSLFADMKVKVGSFTQKTSTGSQAVTGVGFQPKAIFLFGNQNTADGTGIHAGVFIGAAASSTARMALGSHYIDNVSAPSSAIWSLATKAYRIDDQGGTNGSADFTSMDSDGFTVNWATSDGSARVINYLAIGGTDVTNAFAGAANSPATTGNLAVTGVGFKPDVILLFQSWGDITTDGSGLTATRYSIGFATDSTHRAAAAYSARDASITAYHRQSTSKVLYSIVQSELNTADLVSMDSDGFTLSWSIGTASNRFFYLALKGGNYKVGSFTQKTSTGTLATTGVGFQPNGLLLVSDNFAASGTVDNHGRMSLGAASSTTARGTIWSGINNVASGNTIGKHDLDRAQIIKMETEASGGPTLNAAADLSSFDSDGFTLNWGTADSTAREIYYLAMGSSSVATGPVDRAVVSKSP